MKEPTAHEIVVIDGLMRRIEERVACGLNIPSSKADCFASARLRLAGLQARRKEINLSRWEQRIAKVERALR